MSLFYIPIHLVIIAVMAHTIYYKTKTSIFFDRQGSFWLRLNHLCVAFMPKHTWYIGIHMFYYAGCKTGYKNNYNSIRKDIITNIAVYVVSALSTTKEL